MELEVVSASVGRPLSSGRTRRIAFLPLEVNVEMGITMRNIGLLLALAVVVFLIHKHMQTAPVVGGQVVGGAFSTPDDSGSFGDSNAFLAADMVAGNPNY